MSTPEPARLPRILVIDDLFGRTVVGSMNEERVNLCARFLLRDITGDAPQHAPTRQVAHPRAEAVFVRGQTPSGALVGDTVENSIEECLDAVRRGWNPARGVFTWSLVLVDLCFYTGRVTSESNELASGMPEGRLRDGRPTDYFGLEIIAALRRHFPQVPVIILSSMSRDDVSREFTQLGALGFIPRSGPDSPRILTELLWQHGLLPDPEGEVVGESLPVLLALREARRASRHGENLLVRGERGTGKELMARYVHHATKSITGNRPFVTVNSAVFTPNLFAAELFGIEPRTATGVDGKVGLIEMADGGDLFLDEIGDMSLEVQAAVLRALQERQITRVGSRLPKYINVRFISATNINFEDQVREFRSDLLDRLRLGGTIWLAPLRERLTDIVLLVEKFVREAEAQLRGSLHRDISAEAIETLAGYHWPGNIRELRSVIFDAINRFPDVEHLVPGHLRLDGGRRESAAENAPRRATGTAVGGPHMATPEGCLDELLSQLTGTVFTASGVGQWAGRLGELQHEQVRLVARMLQAALEATKRRTPERPDGIIQIHPAAKLVTGDATLTASRAADLFKRLLGPLEKELEGELREAFSIAVRLRPRSVKVVKDTE